MDLANIWLKTECEVYVFNATLLVSFDLFSKENVFNFVDNLKVNYFSLPFMI